MSTVPELPDPETMTLAECGEWVSRFVFAFSANDERSDFARRLGKRIKTIAETP